MKTLFATALCILAVPWFFQVRVPGPGGAYPSLAATPGVVNEAGKNSTQAIYNGNSTALGTNPSGQTACPAYSICVPPPEATLANNLLILPFAYKNATAVTVTGGDSNGTNTWTCANGSQDSGTSEWIGLCYASGTSSVTNAHATLGTTAVTNVEAKLAQAYNIVTSGALDGSIVSCAGASSATANCGTITTNFANDLIYEMVCRVGTPAVASFSVSTGWTGGTADIPDVLPDCMSQWTVAATPGSNNPAIVMATASTYLEVLAAFKPAFAGTAPTGLYSDHEMSWSNNQGSSGTSWPFQFFSSGDLLTLRVSCGGGMHGSTTVPTDSTNTWTYAGTNSLNAPKYESEYYAQGAVADNTGLINVTTTGTGDCVFMFQSWKNAPNPAFLGNGWSDYQASATASSLTLTTTYLPWATKYLSVVGASQDTSTQIGVSAPASGCLATDAGSYGGMPVNGPEPMDENNPFFHCQESTTGNQTVTYTNTASTANGVVGDILSFLAPGGIGIVNYTTCSGTATPLTCTIPAPTAGDLIVVGVMAYNITPRTISAVCIGGNTTCSTGTQLTSIGTNGTTAGTSNEGLTSFSYTLSAPSGGPTSLNVIASNSVTGIEAVYWELARTSGSWAQCSTAANKVSNGTVASGTATGGAITPTAAQSFLAGLMTISSSTTANPAAGNAFIYTAGSVTFPTSGDSANALLTTATTSQNPAWSTNAGTFNSSTACFQ